MPRIGVSLPDWYERKLRLWAKLKGTNRATLSGNIIQARIEANWEQVEKDLEEIAQRRGISREQLEAEWLDEEEDANGGKFDPQ